MISSSTINAIVIGAGHNGLVCATYLAKAGYRVQVLEARDSVGGGASTSNFAEGYQVSGLAHVLHSLHPTVCKDLNLDAAGLQKGTAIDTIALDLGGAHLTLDTDSASGAGLSHRDAEAYTAFKREFRSYAKALEPMMMARPPRLKDMDFQDKMTLAKLGWKLRFGLGAQSMRDFLRVGGINIYDVLNEEFSNPLLKAAIAVDAVMGHHMGPRTPTTVLTYLQRLWGETHSANSLPPGGMGQVSRALENAAREAGVLILTDAKVDKILIQEGRACGVQLESGEEHKADVVVSNADAKTTFLDLAGTSELDAMFAKRIHTTRTNGNVAKLHLGLNALPTITGLTELQMGQRLLIAPDMRYVEHAFNHAKYGEFSEHPILEITIPSIADPTLAPEGHHVMSISASFAPYSLKKGWDEARSIFTDKIIAAIERYAPGLSNAIVARELLTPLDIETQYHVKGGHWHHGELTIDQSFMMRPIHGTAQYNTPIDGLFLCGASAHPGGGISGVPGRNAAQRILAMDGGT